jgi:hypothetical protein
VPAESVKLSQRARQSVHNQTLKIPRQQDRLRVDWKLLGDAAAMQARIQLVLPFLQEKHSRNGATLGAASLVPPTW